MPRENKKRGRREEKKRKRNEDNLEVSSVKRSKLESQDFEEDSKFPVTGDAGDDFISFRVDSNVNEPVFHGMLNEQERNYYVDVSAKIEADDFESDQDRANFIEAVHLESQGKELKIATDPTSSRCLEKVITLSKGYQLKNLFSAFLGDLSSLVEHGLASHCCESLFLYSVPFVGRDRVPKNHTDRDEGQSMEDLFLLAAEELKPNLGYLLFERYASHPVRVLLLALSGLPLETSTKSSGSTPIARNTTSLSRLEHYASVLEERQIPDRFQVAQKDMLRSISSQLDATKIRALLKHPIGSPALQLILRLEFNLQSNRKEEREQTILDLLVEDPEIEEGTAEAQFLESLLYDRYGSRFFETIVSCAPGKTFKKLYKSFLKQRLGPMAKHEIASYVATRILERLGKDDLEVARDQVVFEIPVLIDRHRVAIIKTLIERCSAREADTGSIAEALKSAYGGDSKTFLLQILKSDSGTVSAGAKPNKESSAIHDEEALNFDLHGSLLAQAMLQAEGTRGLVQESILALSEPELLTIAKDKIASRVLQTALMETLSTVPFRRQLVAKFYGNAVELATDPSGSHVIDALWSATRNLHYMKERIARELHDQEAILRESKYGRIVWRNWSMDTFNRRSQDWQALAKGIGQEDAGQDGPPKTAIAKARERYAARKTKDFQRNGTTQPTFSSI